VMDGAFAFMDFADLLGVVSALGFVEDEHVFRGDGARGAGVTVDVVFDSADEGFAFAAGGAEFVLEDLDEGAIAGEEDGGCSGGAFGSGDGEVIQVMGVDRAQSDEGFAGAGDAGDEDECAGSFLGGLVDDCLDAVDSGVGGGAGAADGAEFAVLEQFSGGTDEGGEGAVGVV
jgi:hypothetical protein